jgi:16S rRNA (guanine966-N2)-methyltransferase
LASVGKGDAGAHLRPTTDRVRESLFNVLSHQIDFDGLRVLDLFAGTGALGLEALSRGAAHVTFVDDGRVAQGLIRKNIDLTHSKDRTDLIRRDATRLGDNPGTPCDLVFLDPPYGKSACDGHSRGVAGKRRLDRLGRKRPHGGARRV